jgi:hypothetical protein
VASSFAAPSAPPPPPLIEASYPTIHSKPTPPRLIQTNDAAPASAKRPLFLEPPEPGGASNPVV